MPAAMVLPQETGQASELPSGTPTAVGAGLAEIVSFMTSEREVMVSMVEKQRQEMEAQRREWDAKMETQSAKIEQLQTMMIAAKMEAQRQEADAKIEVQRRESDVKMEAQRLHAEVVETRFRASKVASLQVRLEALYDAKLLEDDELCKLEDSVADAIGAADTDDGADSGWECVMQMIRLSEGIASEKVFARQLRRKFL
eukprot:COSAG02_NODE_4029_length_5885_cov_88.549430_1_plen_199_part_00